MIDIVEIKRLVKEHKLKAYVKDNNIYLENDIGEVVKIGEMEAKVGVVKTNEEILNFFSSPEKIRTMLDAVPEPTMR